MPPALPEAEPATWHVACSTAGVHLFQPPATLVELPAVAPQGPDLTRYLLVCGGLILAIVVLGLGFQRLVAGAWRTRAGRRSLQILDLLPLGGKQRVAVVRVYDRTFLLGMGDKEVRLISELRDQPAEDAAIERGEPKLDFGALLGRVAGRGAARPEGRAGEPRAHSAPGAEARSGSATSLGQRGILG